MSDFADVWGDATGALDGAFGELFRIQPRSVGAYVVGADDPDRPSFTATGIIDRRPMSLRREGLGRFDPMQADRLTAAITIDFAETAFEGAASWPRAGDRMVALEEEGQPVFEVVAPEPSGLGRISFVVVGVSK